MTINEIERVLANHGVIADVVMNKDHTVDIITESLVPYTIRDDLEAIRPLGILFNWVVKSRLPTMSLPSSLDKWYNNTRKYIK
jgi:hypothetical protein